MSVRHPQRQGKRVHRQAALQGTMKAEFWELLDLIHPLVSVAFPLQLGKAKVSSYGLEYCIESRIGRSVSYPA